jgi:hypothetical protein
MKIFLSLLIIISSSAHAKDFGLGIILGAPTGISSIYSMGNGHAIDAALSWDTGGDDKLYVHSTYLTEFSKGLTIDEVTLDAYWGLGARLKVKEEDGDKNSDNDDDVETKIGARASIGVKYFFQKVRIETFLEGSSVFNFVPKTGFDLGVALGGRYYF